MSDNRNHDKFFEPISPSMARTLQKDIHMNGPPPQKKTKKKPNTKSKTHARFGLEGKEPEALGGPTLPVTAWLNWTSIGRTNLALQYLVELDKHWEDQPCHSTYG